MSSFAEIQAQVYSDLRRHEATASISPVPPAAATAVTKTSALARPEAPVPAPFSEPTPAPEPPAIDLTPAAGAAEEAKRKQAHEAAEAKRKSEWDAKQEEKKAAGQAALDQIAAMDGDELLSAAANRVAADTERLTRRNMKEAVAEHIQARCREDVAFARLVMDPDKSMVNCFRYINRQAREYAEQEMEDNGVRRTGTYGLDVPDGLCYQWAEDYFKDENAEEDHKNDEKFIPKPYIPAPSNHKKAQGKANKKSLPAEKPRAKKTADSGMEQLSLM